MGSSVIPPLPPGFQLDEVPPLPPGFKLDADAGEKPSGVESYLQGLKTAPAGLAQIGLRSLQFAQNPLAGEFANILGDQEKSYQYSRGKDAGKLDLPRIAGEMSNPMNWVNPLGQAATTGGRVVTGMLLGGGTSALRPTETEGERVKDAIVGAIIGGIIPVAWEGAKSVGRFGRNLFQGKFAPESAAGRIANEVAGSRRDAVINSLMDAETGQTAQQAAVPSGSAEFAGLTEIASKRQPSEYVAIDKAQQVARRNALKDAGGTPEAIAQAVGDRAMAASQLYGDAMQVAVKADPELARIASNPFYKDVVPDALKVMESRTGGNGKPNLTEFLQVVKEALDQKIGNFGDTALNKAAKREAVKVQDQLMGWLEKKNPEFAKAQAQYAKDSIPVNQGQVLQYLEGVVRNPLDVKEMPGAFANAVKKAPSTIEKATGREYSDIGSLMSPDQMAVIDSLVKQYQNNALGKELAMAGTEKAARHIGDLSHIQGTGMLNRYITLATSGMRKLSSGSTEAAMEATATLGRDPKRFAEVMQKAKPFERQEIVDLLMEMQARGAGMAFAPQGDSK